MAQYGFGAGVLVGTAQTDANGNTITTPTPIQVGILQADGRVLIAEAARGMTTRFDPVIYGQLAKHPALAGAQIDPLPPTQPPQRKYAPRS